MERAIWNPRGKTIDTSDESMNIEEVLTLLKQWEQGKCVNPPLNFARNLRIQKQLLGCVYRSVYMDKADNHERFMNQFIRHLDTRFDHVTWGTFNWDAKLEQAFYREMEHDAAGRLPKCMPELQDWDGSNDKHLMLKLHGSVSWFERPGAGGVYNLPFGRHRPPLPINVQWGKYLSGASEDKPLIAEPSFFKHEEINTRPLLRSQWEAFDDAMAVANTVFICGYSLPDGDARAKQSLLTAVARRDDVPWIVVDPDSRGEVRQRYERILGGAPRLDFRQQYMADFVASL
jgi:hypothetical protein